MRFLVIASKENSADYIEFVQNLNSLGAEALCIDRLKYCFLSQFPPLYVIPFPKLLGLVKQFNPDYIITDSSDTVRMAKLLDSRVLLHMLGHPWIELYFGEILRTSFFVRLYTHYLNKTFDSGAKNADIILANSKWLQGEIQKRFPAHPTRVLNIGINAEKWIPSSDHFFRVKHPAVAGLFPFNVYPKVLGVLKFVKVIRKMPDVNFYFAGDGPYLNLVAKRRPPNMILVGRVSRPRAKQLLESADVFVHPSGLDVLPRSVKEASLMEKPIVASNIGGIPEIVRNNETGYLCGIDDADEWIGRIRFLLDNPGVAMELGRNARRFVMTVFDWRKIARNFLNELER